jgi:Rieske 2Fe-2S family protein
VEPALPRAAYVGDDVWADERERLFARQWCCVGRTEGLEARGDWRSVEVGGESVLLVRDGDRIRGFYNLCRHRGSQLVDEGGEGRFAGAVRCPYHSWTYGLDGRLRRAPFLDGLDPEGHSLHPVGVDTWGGFVFAHLESDGAEPLADQLGPLPARTRRYPLAELRRGARLVYDVAANWKVLAENYNECYHCGPVHPELCRLVPAFRGGGQDLDWEAGIPHRPGAWTFTETGTTTRARFPDLDEDEQVRHKGELVYPNLLLSLAADHVLALLLVPQGPGRTRVEADFLFAPDELATEAFDPSDVVTFWDRINRQDWQACERVQRGMGSRAYTHGWFAPMEDESADIRRWYQGLMADPG